MKIKTLIMAVSAAVLAASSCGSNSSSKVAEQAIPEDSIYNFTVVDNTGKEVSLADYKGEVLLVVNTATACGFTPQYEDLDNLYDKFCDKGFTILDFPCNQFGGQAPGTDTEIEEFCTLRYGTEFPRFHKVDVNGENEIPLYTWLKSKAGFAGLDPDHQLTPILDGMFKKQDENYAENPSIKWNFTKFLIDRNGNVVKRFEPTATQKDIEPEIENLL